MGIDAVVATWLFGLISGMRHAFEPDHVAAVSTLVAEGRGSRRAAWLGASWGLGHTTALLGVGLVLGLLRAQLPAAVESLLELGVAIMLLGLGARAVRHAMADVRGGPDAWHAHGGRPHHHPARASHLHLGLWMVSPRSFVIGIVHGLAGSGTLVALAMTELATMPARLLYVALFGLGSVVAMSLLSGLAGWQLSRFAARRGVRVRLQLAAGALSLVVGLVWALPLLREVLG
jgi:hypothetical protein